MIIEFLKAEKCLSKLFSHNFRSINFVPLIKKLGNVSMSEPGEKILTNMFVGASEILKVIF